MPYSHSGHLLALLDHLGIARALHVPCFRNMAGMLADRIPGACKVTVPGAGHMVNMEAPHVVNALLREVVTTL